MLLAAAIKHPGGLRCFETRASDMDHKFLASSLAVKLEPRAEALLWCLIVLTEDQVLDAGTGVRGQVRSSLLVSGHSSCDEVRGITSGAVVFSF